MIDMSPRSKVIQRIEDDIETLEPVDVELSVHDIRVVCFELRTGLKLLRNLLRYLYPYLNYQNMLVSTREVLRARRGGRGAISQGSERVSER